MGKKALIVLIAIVAALTLALAGCSGSGVKSTSKASGNSGKSAKSEKKAEKDYSNLKVGDSVTLENGLVITVTDAQEVQQEFSDDTQICVTVSYKNTGEDSQSYNLFDWKSENKDGVERSIEMAIGDDNALDSGKLKPGGKISGNVYFKNDIKKVYYYSNGLFQSESEICWKI